MSGQQKLNPIRIGNDDARKNGSLPPKPPLAGLRIAPQSLLSQGGKVLHSTSNKMAAIYKQPIAPVKAKGAKNGNHAY